MSTTSTDYLLCVDVGNSRIKFGLFDRASIRPDGDELPVCLNSYTVPLADAVPWDTLVDWCPPESGKTVAGIIAGVNPAGIHKVVDTWAVDRWLLPPIVQDPSALELPVSVEAPRQVGIDRLLNAVAVNVVRPPEQPVIIVDSGTATTVDYVTAAGVFAGGAILPGFELMARSLHQYTALLPLITAVELAASPRQPLGENTRAALQSGLFWGQLGAVRELIAQYSEFSSTPPGLFLCGGGAALLAEHLPDARWEPELALQGLALVAGAKS